MPVYQYRDKSTGKVVELSRPVDRRDDVPSNLERILVAGPSVLRGTPPDTGASYKVPRALRQIEGGRTSARDISRHFGMSVDTIKRVWAMSCLLFLACVAAGADINPGYSFQDGQRLTASQLQQLVGSATILPSFVSGKPVDNALSSSDVLLVYSGGALYQATLQNLVLLNTNLISSQPTASSVGPSDALLLLSGHTLYQINPASLLTNQIALGPAVTNWPPVAMVTNADQLLIFSTASNRLATATLSNVLAYVQTNAGLASVSYVQSKLPVVWGYTNNFTCDIAAIFNQNPGFANNPQSYRFNLLCTTADSHFSLGQEIPIESVFLGTTSSTALTNAFVVRVAANMAQISLYPGNAAGASQLQTWDTTGGSGRIQLTPSHWTLDVHMIYFPP